MILFLILIMIVTVIILLLHDDDNTGMMIIFYARNVTKLLVTETQCLLNPLMLTSGLLGVKDLYH